MNKLLVELLNIKESIAESNDREERIELKKELSEIKNEISKLLPEGVDWDSRKGLSLLGLSDNQIRFVMAAWDNDLLVYSYSGRGMYGERCPAVTSDNLPFNANVLTDNMGLSYVFYARY